MAAHELLDEDVIALGDGANDVAMLERAGIGVAYRAHQKVRARVPIRLEVADLTGALYLQGYRRDGADVPKAGWRPALAGRRAAPARASGKCGKFLVGKAGFGQNI